MEINGVDCKWNKENNEVICLLKCNETKDCYYKQLRRKEKECEELWSENGHYNYLITAYHVCFGGALGAIQELQKNNCDNPTYWANIAKIYLGYRYEERKEAENIYNKHFLKYKQALDEIEKLADDLCCDNCQNNCDEILEIIKKVKENKQ